MIPQIFCVRARVYVCVCVCVCVCGLFTFRGHSTREPASSRITYFIVRVYTGTKNSGEVWEKNAGEWTGRVDISKEEIPDSKRIMYGYILTYSRL